MSTFDTIRRQALGLLNDASDALRKHGDESGATTVADARRQLLDGKVTAIVIGEYKRGKSSLLSALVEDKALFPINVDIATSLITTIENAAEEEITVFIGPPGASTAQWITRDQIADYVTEQGNPRNAKAARLIRIQTPNPRLRDGLVLIDTPGVGGLNVEHTAITMAILGNADVAIFVIDALTPMTVNELTMLETTARLGAQMLLVITKSDKVVDHSAAISNARSKLVGVLGPDLGDAIPIITVSSTAKLDWVTGHDPDDLADSNFEALDTALWEMLGERGGGLLLARALSRTVGALEGAIELVQAQLVALEGDSGEIELATNTALVERDRLDSLGASGALWRSSLVDACGSIRQGAAKALAARMGTIAERLDAQLAAARKARHEEVILNDLERDITVVWTELVGQMRGEIARLSDTIEAQTGLSVNPGLTYAGRLTAFDSFGRRRTKGDSDITISGLEAAGFIGEVISWIAGVGPLYLISQVVTMFGMGSTKANNRRVEFDSNVRDQLGRAERELQSRLSELIDNAEQSITSSYERMIHDRRYQVQATTQVLRGGRDESKRAQKAEAVAELTGLYDRTTELIGQANLSAASV